MQTVRITRRAKQRARRHTYKQRGGAAWAPVFASEEDARFNDWKAEIDGNEELKALFPSLQLLDRNKATTDQEKQERLLTYFNCMAHQDKLFRAALNIIRKKVVEHLGITDNKLPADIIISNAAAIDTQKSALMEYFRDVERMVSFVEDTRGAKPKMRQMYIDTDATLSTLLLFPSRIENVFIGALSEIICNLIEDSSIVRTATSKPIIKVLATQYDSYAQALAHTLTAFPIRDGFFLNQSLASIEKLSMKRTNPDAKPVDTSAEPTMSTFWDKFVEEVRESLPIIDERDLFKNKSEQVSSCTNYIHENSWSRHTADMMMYAKIKSGNMTILGHFTEECKDISLGSMRMIPDPPYFDVTINGVPLQNILSNIDINTLEYLLHLEVAIKECLARREKEKGITTPE